MTALRNSLVTLQRALRVPTIAALLVWLLACDSGSFAGPPSELARAAAEGRWAREAPASYRFTIHRSCECLPEMTGPTIVVVSNGVVASRTYVATGAAVPAAYADLFPPAEGLFEVIDSARRQGARRVEARYDAAYGYPVHILIDFDGEWGNDDEVVYTVSGFQTP